MSFAFKINNNREIQAIEISLVKHLLLPLVIAVIGIFSVSLLLESRGFSTYQPYRSQTAISQYNLNHLQQKIAALEGESQRLRAFAKRVVKLANLDNEVFNLDQPPARGGLGGRNIFRRETSQIYPQLGRDLESIKKQLIQQSNQFERMQLVLKSRELGELSKSTRWPIQKGYISSTFGIRKDPFTGRRKTHNGLDLAGPRGSPIYSIAAGEVVFSGRNGGYGKMIEIKHANGLTSRYAHLEASLVKKGQQVAAGESIARLGSTGRSTGPHLHLEILRDNKNIDPLRFLRKAQ